MDQKKYLDFYEKEFHGKLSFSSDGPQRIAEDFFQELKKIIKDFNLENKKILEVGSGDGKLQDVMKDYTGLDIARNLKSLYHKPYFLIESDGSYPFSDELFDGVFTRAVFEHIPDIDKELNEMLRVLKSNGYILFNAAWQVRSWASEGYEVRPYQELNFREKLIKFSILWRDKVFFRSLFVFPRRMWRTIIYCLNLNFAKTLDYKKIKANYEKFWTPDSDACNSIDPHAMILWFMANNCRVLNYPNLFKAFFVRSGSLVVQKMEK